MPDVAATSNKKRANITETCFIHTCYAILPETHSSAILAQMHFFLLLQLNAGMPLAPLPSAQSHYYLS